MSELKSNILKRTHPVIVALTTFFLYCSLVPLIVMKMFTRRDFGLSRKKRVFLGFLFLVTGSWLVIDKLDKHIMLKSFIKDNLMPQSLVRLIDRVTREEAIENFLIKRYGHTCSEEVSRLGSHQKVISYSFYQSSTTDGYWVGLNHTLKRVSALYPGWQVRIYGRTDDIQFLRSRIHKFPFLFYCDVSKLPPPLPNLERHIPTVVRYAPLSDPQVDVVIFRDTDSTFLEREIDAVQEWLDSNKTLHVMRDHYAHSLFMLGGLWGIKQNRANQIKIRDMRDKLIALTFAFARYDVDQPTLKKVIYDAMEDDIIAHDSYHCERFSGSSPWPTKRNKNLEFVGAQYYKTTHRSVNRECPIACRPTKHLDWNYC